MKKILLSSFAVMALATGAATAADLPVKAVAAPAPVSLWEVEIGARYFYSTGRMRYTLGSNVVPGQTNSQLTYKDMQSNAGEAFARVDHSSGFFVKGFLGAGNIFKGALNDEDFPPATLGLGNGLYSNTLSSINNSRLWYGTGDLGYSFWQTSTYKVGIFVGYNHFYETANGYGCNQVGQNTICGPGQIAPSFLILSDTQNWDSARLGVNGVFKLMPNLKLTVDAALLPYVSETGHDNHWARPDINPLPQAGHGWGYQLESILAYDFTPNFSVGVGGRYWFAETTTGTTQFPLVAVSPTKFTTERYGGFFQASYKFGDAAVVAKY